MQFLPLYVTKNYIDPFPKRVINKSSYLPSPGEVCQSRLARYQTFEGSFALKDKIKKSPLLRTEGELFRWHFFNTENKTPGACRHCKEKLHSYNGNLRQYMSLAAAQPAKRNLQRRRSWWMQERQNHLAPIIVFQIQVTRKAIYVHC